MVALPSLPPSPPFTVARPTFRGYSPAPPMKVRASLLIVFMVAVPAVAMFSHRIPADVRRAVRERASRMVARKGVDVSRPPSSAALAVEAAPRGPASPADVPVVGAGLPAEAEIDARLAALGAVAVDCRPLAAGAGHAASCSVPLDETGQLLRVFHATGPDARAARDALAAEVSGWRVRTAGPGVAARPPAAGPGSADRSRRF